jgi:PAS domain S-box-containing protein
LKLGAVDFVSKPFQIEELLARVQTHVDLRRLRVRLEQQAVELQLANEQLQIEITERKQAELILHENEEIFNRFMENSPIYVFFKDENIRPIRLSRNYEKMLGRPLAELLGKNMEELFPSELAKNMVADDKRILKEGKEINVEEELNGRFYTTIKFPIHIEGKPRYLAGYTIDITERKRAEEALWETSKERENLIRELQYALDNIKTLQGLIPICANCKKIRDDKGYWNQVEGYISEHTDAEFTHGICPDCAKKLYGDLYEKAIKKP